MCYLSVLHSVYECVCVREREGERKRAGERAVQNDGSPLPGARETDRMSVYHLL